MEIHKAHHIAAMTAWPLFAKYDLVPIVIEIHHSHVCRGMFIPPNRIMVFLSDKTTDADVVETVRHEICHYIQFTNGTYSEEEADVFEKEGK